MEPIQSFEQASLSKFHAWNFRFGATKYLWTLLKMLLQFRQAHMAETAETDKQDPESEAPAGNAEEPRVDNTEVQDVGAKIAKLQRTANTMTTAISVLSDTQLRRIAYMTHSCALSCQVSTSSGSTSLFRPRKKSVISLFTVKIIFVFGKPNDAVNRLTV